MDFRKFQRVPPFTFFGTVTLFKNHILKFFWAIFFKSLKGPPSIFFIFCHQLEFHKTQRVPPFTILSLRYSADFGRSRLVSGLCNPTYFLDWDLLTIVLNTMFCHHFSFIGIAEKNQSLLKMPTIDCF